MEGAPVPPPKRSSREVSTETLALATLVLLGACALGVLMVELAGCSPLGAATGASEVRSWYSMALVFGLAGVALIFVRAAHEWWLEERGGSE